MNSILVARVSIVQMCRPNWTVFNSLQLSSTREKQTSLPLPRRTRAVSIVYLFQHFNTSQGSNLLQSIALKYTQINRCNQYTMTKGKGNQNNKAWKGNHHNSSLSSAGGETTGRPESFAKSTPIFLRHFSQRAWKSFSIPLSI